jgi:hypothetical protein
MIIRKFNNDALITIVYNNIAWPWYINTTTIRYHTIIFASLICYYIIILNPI